MNRNFIILGVVGFVVLLLLWGVTTNISYQNKFVTEDEEINQAWAKVQTQYQRRADLIPNLVATVKGAADFEKSTLEAVTNARARATSINIDPSNLSAEKLAEFQAAQGQLSQGLGRLLATAENYPTLQSNAQFRDLQVQLEGTENRIATARDRFNEEVSDLNIMVRKFPGSFFASLQGVETRPMFEATAVAADQPVKVEF